MEAARSTSPIPKALAEATRHQPRAGFALAAALSAPAHAYLFRGPRGSGKAAAARAFAAELLAEGATDPDDARRRALLDPSPHPDLVWLRPPPPGRSAPGEARPRAGDPRLQPFARRGQSTRFRDRGGRGSARREPERA